MYTLHTSHSTGRKSLLTGHRKEVHEELSAEEEEIPSELIPPPKNRLVRSFKAQQLFPLNEHRDIA